MSEQDALKIHKARERAEAIVWQLVIDQLFVAQLLLRFGPFQNTPRDIFVAKTSYTFLLLMRVVELSGTGRIALRSYIQSSTKLQKLLSEDSFDR
jgi:hypothetical protein